MSYYSHGNLASVDMRRGYINGSERYPAKEQRRVLEEARVKVIYEESARERLADFIGAMRRGDTMVVEGLNVLAKTRPELFDVLTTLNDKGIAVEWAGTGLQAPLSVVAAVVGDLSKIAGERRIKSLEDAARRGGLGGAPAKPVSKGARAIWRDLSIPTNADAAKLIGLSERQCYRKWKASGRKAGWPSRS